MRIAHRTGSKKTWRPGLVVLLAVLLTAPLGVLRAEEPAQPAQVSAANVEVSYGALMVSLSVSRPSSVRTFSLTNPDRLVVDIENAVLALAPGAESSWAAPMAGVVTLGISQFSADPPVVRVVAEVSDSALQVEKEYSDSGLRLAFFKGDSPFARSGPGAPPEQLRPTIQRFIHQALADGRDQFSIEFSFGVVLPQVRIESPTVMLLRFPGTGINLPSPGQTSYSTEVSGKVVQRMRAEILESGGNVSTEIRLTVPNTAAVGYTLETSGDRTIQLVVFSEAPSVAPSEPAQPASPVPDTTSGGQIMVLSSTDQPPLPSEAGTRITRVQFQTIGPETDRFFIYYEGGPLEPRVQRFNYPTRVIFYFPDTAVLLPESAGDRFQTRVDGVLAKEMKVFNRVIEDVGPECQFSFYFPAFAQENIGFTLDYPASGQLYIDFYRSSTPTDVASPVEVNLSIPEAQPEPIPEPQPVAEIAEEPTAVEEPEVPEVEVVAVQEQAAEEAPMPLPQPQQPATPPLPLITVVSGEVVDGVVVFRLRSSEPLPEPQWVSFRYPERLGLRFPLSEVRLLDAPLGQTTTYTHIRAVPIVRAIVKNRADDQSTTITWTLAGTVEEYTPSFERNGNELTVRFEYNPVQTPVQVEQTPIQVEQPPVVVPEEPAAVPEASQPEVSEPVVVQPQEPVVERPTETEVAEPVQVVEVPAVQAVQEEAAVVEPEQEAVQAEVVPQVSAQLPLLTVSLGDVSEDTVVFNIETSQQLPMPQWVEYRYPDRIGLRFPLSDVRMLNAPQGVSVAQTRVRLIPLVRAIVKDRPDEQYTTICWTLGGALEEYTRELEWNGTQMRAVFHYRPIPSAPPSVEPPPAPFEPVAPPQVVPAEETSPVQVEVEVEVYSDEKPGTQPAPEEKPSEPAGAEQESKPVAESEAEPPKIEEVEIEARPVSAGERREAASEERPVVGSAPAPFEGVTITGISFEKRQDADVIVLTTSGPVEDWEILPVNFPTKLMVTLRNCRLELPAGAQRASERVSGTWVDEYSIAGIVSADSSSVTLSAYAHGVESTDLLMFDVQSNANKWTLAVFQRGASSPLRAAEGSSPRSSALQQLEPLPVAEASGGVEGQIDVGELSETGPKISMRLEDADIRDVLQLIAEQAGLNISIGPSVTGNITITLTDVGLFDLLDLLGSQLGFTYVVRHGVYIFGKSSELQEQFSYMERWFVSLSYADPDQVRNILVSLRILGGDQIQVYRGDYGTTSLSIASPQLILMGERKDLERAYGVIATLDQPPVMVQVDFQILNTSLTDNKNFGFQFHPGTAGYTGGASLVFSEQPSENNDLGPFPQGFDRLGSIATNRYTIQLAINYLVENGYAELMNRSSLTVANNQTGTLFVGQNVPYRSTYQVSELGRVTQRVATQSIGLTLDFRPHANPDGTVTLMLRPSNSNLLELTDVGPHTVDQRFTTTVRARDGEPFIIGGFISDEERVKYDRFPFLSELPLLGHLFRNREVRNTKSELIFVFTPHIINPTRHLPEVRTDADIQVPLPMNLGGSY